MHAIAIAISLWAHPAVPLPPPFCCCCDPLLLLSFSLFVSVFLVACEPKKERETRRMTAKGKKKTLTHGTADRFSTLFVWRQRMSRTIPPTGDCLNQPRFKNTLSQENMLIFNTIIP